MGFFDSLATLGKNFLADAEKALGKVSSRSTLARVVQASYLIALADGHVDDSEKLTLGKVIQRKLPYFSNSDVAKEIAAAEDLCALSLIAGKVEILENIQKAAGTDDAKIIMLGILAVANADSEFSPSEMQVARDICIKLGLSTREYGL